jgi:ribosomal protein S18 acetylase RimI-like enzyme
MNRGAEIPIIIKPASRRDLARIQRVHQAAFPDFFLSRMGGPFLRAYYGAVLGYRRGRIIAAWQDEQLVGFVGVFIDPVAFCQAMAANRWRFLLPMLWGVLRRPHLLPRVLFNRERVMNLAPATAVSSERQCELASICVAPSAGQQGIGHQLMDAARRFAIQEQASQIVLTTDAEGNEAVNYFYRKLGYTCEATFRSGKNRLMNRYTLALSEQDGTD